MRVIAKYVGELIVSDPRSPKPAKSVKVKPVKSVQPRLRFDDMPDVIRYQEWLRDRAFMERVMS